MAWQRVYIRLDKHFLIQKNYVSRKGMATIMSIYLDVLLIINIYVNYFLIKATAKLTHTKLHTSKCVISALVGSIFSLVILLPPLNFFVSFIIKLLAATIVVAIAFGISDKKRFAKMTLFFFSINFIFAGVMLSVYILIEPPFMQFNNSYFYIDFSLITLVISTIIAYVLVSIIRFLLDKKAVFNEKYKVIFTTNGNTISLDAIADTGNTLIDVFSGRPVIICNINQLDKVLPREYKYIFSSSNIEEIQSYILNHKLLKGLKLIPFSTINSNGVIPIFSADSVYIQGENTKKIKNVNALIGICSDQGNSYDAIFNPNLII